MDPAVETWTTSTDPDSRLLDWSDTLDFFSNGSVDGSEEDYLMDTHSVPYPGEIQSRPLWEIVLKCVAYGIIILLAFIGNLLVVFIVWQNKRMRTTTNYFIVNLAVSDLMVTSSCTWVHLVDDLTEGWVLGAFFCKFNSFAQVLSLVSSILTLTLISCDRFFGIVFAMKARMTERRSPWFILAVWVCAIGISSPLLVYRQQYQRFWLDHVEIWCADTWPEVKTTTYVNFNNSTVPIVDVQHPSRTFYYTFISVVLYFFPILVMSVAYSLIVWRLWSSHMPGERVESEVRAQNKIKKRVVIMLVIILSVFALCWLPFQISILYSEYRPDKEQLLPAWYPKFNFFASYVAYANSAFNPIIYTGFNENFKRGFKSVFTCFRRKKSSYSAVYGPSPGLHRQSSFNRQKVKPTSSGQQQQQRMVSSWRKNSPLTSTSKESDRSSATRLTALDIKS